jgi:hypothetical protein
MIHHSVILVEAHRHRRWVLVDPPAYLPEGGISISEDPNIRFT